MELQAFKQKWFAEPDSPVDDQALLRDIKAVLEAHNDKCFAAAVESLRARRSYYKED